MTERGRSAVHATARSLAIGPSSLQWQGDHLVIDIDEVCVPIPRRIKGRVRVHPTVISEREFGIDQSGRHRWRAIAPRARIDVEMQAPSLSWSGTGYLDTNAGDEPLEAGFHHWHWSRADCGAGATVLYHTTPRLGPPVALALRCDGSGVWQPFEPARHVRLPTSPWLIPRATYADAGGARVLKTFEDGPFYTRSLISADLLGETRIGIHESVSLDRFAQRWVKAMLPYRMPRARL